MRIPTCGNFFHTTLHPHPFSRARARIMFFVENISGSQAKAMQPNEYKMITLHEIVREIGIFA
jgi:hypothetical protein